MKRKIENLYNNIFNKNSRILNSIILLVSGTAFAQLINLFLTPIITRIYTPEEYGLYTVYISLLTILGIGSLEYNRTISISKNDKEAINLVFISLILVCFTTVVISLLFFMLHESLISILNLSSPLMLIFLCIGILFSGVYKVFMHWSFRQRNYKLITKTKLTQSIAGNLLIILLGILNFNVIGILTGAVTKTLFGISTLFKPFSKVNYKNMNFSFTAMMKLLLKYKNFALYTLPSEIFRKSSEHLPILFLTMLYGTSITGYYGLAYTIISLPLILVGNSVSDVFFSEAAKMGSENSKDIKVLSLKLCKKLIQICFIPFILLFLAGPNLFEIIFGDNWYEAGQFASALTLLGFTVVVFDPVSKVYDILNKQRERLYFDTFKFLTIIIAFTLAITQGISALNTVYIYSVTLAFINVMIYLRSLYLLK